jgi:hypothetical protein
MLTNSPRSDEVEISIFGPGKGESVLVHIGCGQWIIVDSCIDFTSNTIPALSYLHDIGVEVDRDVRMVVGTHLHDDHIAGISNIFEECKSAFFACSSALMGIDFASLLEADLQAELGLRKGVYSEFRRIHEIADERRLANGGRRFLKRAIEDLPLIDEKWSNGLGAKVVALAPSHEAVTRSLRQLATVAPVNGQPRRPFRGDPNECSVVLWIDALDKALLLGADLLKGPAGCGWSGILSSFKPDDRASVFKVPHHGAPNADADGVWQQLLSDKPVALLAPYRAGSRPRPDPDDCSRICNRTPLAFITAGPRPPAPGEALRVELTELGRLPENVRQPWAGGVGQVRARSSAGDSGWTVDLFPPAQDLCRRAARPSNRQGAKRQDRRGGR